jgi:hypothetical protein
VLDARLQGLVAGVLGSLFRSANGLAAGILCCSSTPLAVRLNTPCGRSPLRTRHRKTRARRPLAGILLFS